MVSKIMRMSLLVRFALLFVLLCCGGVSSDFAAAADKAFSFEFYQQKYSVIPMQVEGTPLTFDQVKPYVLIVFPDMKTLKKERVDTIYMVDLLVLGYQRVYDDGIRILANRLEREGKWSGDDKDALRAELKQLFRAGGMKAGIVKYAGEDKSLALHFGQVQELYLRHLTSVYIFNMLAHSPEGMAAIAAYKAENKDAIQAYQEEHKDEIEAAGFGANGERGK